MKAAVLSFAEWLESRDSSQVHAIVNARADQWLSDGTIRRASKPEIDYVVNLRPPDPWFKGWDLIGMDVPRLASYRSLVVFSNGVHVLPVGSNGVSPQQMRAVQLGSAAAFSLPDKETLAIVKSRIRCDKPKVSHDFNSQPPTATTYCEHDHSFTMLRAGGEA